MNEKSIIGTNQSTAYWIALARRFVRGTKRLVPGFEITFESDPRNLLLAGEGGRICRQSIYNFRGEGRFLDGAIAHHLSRALTE